MSPSCLTVLLLITLTLAWWRVFLWKSCSVQSSSSIFPFSSWIWSVSTFLLLPFPHHFPIYNRLHFSKTVWNFPNICCFPDSSHVPPSSVSRNPQEPDLIRLECGEGLFQLWKQRQTHIFLVDSFVDFPKKTFPQDSPEDDVVSINAKFHSWRKQRQEWNPGSLSEGAGDL